jgi:hypothetical protein
MQVTFGMMGLFQQALCAAAVSHAGLMQARARGKIPFPMAKGNRSRGPDPELITQEER